MLGLSAVQLAAAACCLLLAVGVRRVTPRLLGAGFGRALPRLIGGAGRLGALLLAAIVVFSVLAWDRVDPFARQGTDAWSLLCLACYLAAGAWPVVLAPVAIGYLARGGRADGGRGDHDAERWASDGRAPGRSPTLPGVTSSDPLHPPVPPVSRRSQPRFRSRERRAELAEAFTQAGADYDRLRPGYPDEALAAILAALPDEAPTVPGSPAESARPAAEDRSAGASVAPAAAGRRTAVDLGAGTGKLSAALAARGLAVTAVDPAASMLDALRAPGVERVVGTAEATGLPDACADLVTAAQAWHWFEADAASAEVLRLLRPGGVLALLWNTLDVQIPWVHRYSRIMHAGDVQRDDFAPPVAGGLALAERVVVRWEDPMATPDLVDLARTRSYVITAQEERREKVLANLDWYVHEHLGHERASTVGLPYRTDLFLYRAA